MQNAVRYDAPRRGAMVKGAAPVGSVGTMLSLAQVETSRLSPVNDFKYPIDN